MASLLFNPISWVWLLLVAATAASWELGHGLGFAEVRHASLAVIAVSLFKVRLVMFHFMEVRHAPLGVRLVADAWLLGLGTVLCVLYLRAA